MIPRGALSDRFSKASFSQLSTELEASDYELATDLNGLLKMNVVDCFFLSHQMHITEHITFKVKSTKYQLYEVLSAPWQFGNQ